MCLAGRFTIEMREEIVVLDPGDVFTVPCGVEHSPHAAKGTRILMFEREGTATTGDDHATSPISGQRAAATSKLRW
jgi:mannose-6-phosphate isomerase-like protein (cupin superfamily)